LGNMRLKATKTELDSILNFVERATGLSALVSDDGDLQIVQDIDSKIFAFSMEEVTEVLHRQDAESKAFLQINFKNSNKVLLTETLVGFKPSQTLGLDMTKLPKVVTTPDLVSVFDAIEDAMGSDQIDHEIEILKKVYLAIVSGGEKVGFDLKDERRWLNRLLGSRLRASA